MIIWALTGIFVIFILFAFLRMPLYKKFGFKVCAICAAVSLTWIALLALKLAGLEISNLLLGILMGESVTGVMYLFENTAKKEGKHKMLWLKVFIILLGTALVYLFLTQGFSLGFILAFIISIIFAVIIYSILKSTKSNKNNEPIHKKYGKFEKEIKKLEEKFEHCCY